MGAAALWRYGFDATGAQPERPALEVTLPFSTVTI